MKALFVCNLNRNRSKTAEHLFRDRMNTRSAGLFSGNLLSEEMLLWADVIFVMDETQKNEIAIRFPDMYTKKEIIALGISDDYFYNQPELIEVLEQKMKKYM